MTSRTFENIREYVMSNSRIISLQKLKDHILVEVEHFQNGEPIIRYHLFDFDYNYVGYVDAGVGDWVNYIRGVKENRLYFWGENYTETGESNNIRVRELIVD